MAGIYDRILPETDDNVPVHILYAAIVTYSEGIFTKVQIRNAINGILQSPLTSAEETDLDGIADGIDAEVGVNNKLRYLHRLNALSMAIEIGISVTETQYRNNLGI